MRIITTFAWSPDSGTYGPLTGSSRFLMEYSKGSMLQARLFTATRTRSTSARQPGTTHAYATPNGFPGSRQRYESARSDIRKWRCLSSNPESMMLLSKWVWRRGLRTIPGIHPRCGGWQQGILVVQSAAGTGLQRSIRLGLVEHTKYGQPDKTGAEIRSWLHSTIKRSTAILNLLGKLARSSIRTPCVAAGYSILIVADQPET